MKYAAILMAVLGAGLGCSAQAASSDQVTIKKFEDVAPNAGKTVTATGVISLRHGARGLYFKWSDLRKENDNCIGISPLNDLSHGDRVRITGSLKKTDCADGWICLSNCVDYVLSVSNIKKIR